MIQLYSLISYTCTLRKNLARHITTGAPGQSANVWTHVLHTPNFLRSFVCQPEHRTQCKCVGGEGRGDTQLLSQKNLIQMSSINSYFHIQLMLLFRLIKPLKILFCFRHQWQCSGLRANLSRSCTRLGRFWAKEGSGSCMPGSGTETDSEWLSSTWRKSR